MKKDKRTYQIQYMGVSTPWYHSYSRYLLKKLRREIYAGRKKILDAENPIMANKDNVNSVKNYFEFFVPRPAFKLNDFDKSNEVMIITNMEELNNMGFYVNSYPARIKQWHFQSKEYHIERNRGETAIKRFPTGCYVEYDIGAQRLIYVVNNDFGRFKMIRGALNLKRKEREEEATDYMPQDNSNLYQQVDLQIDDFFNIARDNEDQMFKIPEDELPIGIDNRNYKLVCIPKLPDTLRIGFVGKTKSNKTYGASSLTSMLYYHWNVPIGFINDWKREFLTKTTRMTGTEYIRNLQRINLTPMPLPCVFLDPCIERFPFSGGPEYIEGIGYEFSISWKDFIRKYNKWLAGFEEFDLTQSRKYIMQYIHLLEIAKSPEDVRVIIKEHIEDNNKFEPGQRKQVAGKLNATFDFLFSKKIIDISTDNIPSKFKVRFLDKHEDKIIKEEILHPFIACMYAGVIPILRLKHLESVELGKTNILANYFNNLLEEIYEIKNHEKLWDRSQQIHLDIDELGRIVERGSHLALTNLFDLARIDKISISWSSQSFITIDNAVPSVTKNTDYLFAAGLSDEELRAINKKFPFEKSLFKSFHELGKTGRKHEVYLFHEEPVVLYDLETGKREENAVDPIKMQYIPPVYKTFETKK